MKLLVCGGRNYTDRAWVEAALAEVHLRRGPITLLVHGGAAGADTLAHRWAVKNRVACAVAHGRWNGRPAGPAQLLDLEKPDLVLCFPGGRWTASMVRLAKARGVFVELA